MNEVSSIVHQMEKLGEFSAASWVSLFLFVLVAVWLLFRVSALPFDYLWRRGYDPQRNLLGLKRAIRALIVVTAIAYIVDKIYEDSPQAGMAVVFLALTTVLFSQKSAIGNFFSGIILLFQGDVRLGSRVTVGDISGNVSAIDLLHLKLKADDGALILMPNSTVVSDPVKISLISLGYPVEIEVDLKDKDSMTPESLYDLAIASPFRKSNSDVEIERTSYAGAKTVNVKFYVWSNDVINDARNHFFNNLNEMATEV
jgi:hypothetical protein